MICWLCTEIDSVTLWGCNIWRRKEDTVRGVSGGPPTPRVHPTPVSGRWTRTRSFQLRALMLIGAQRCTWNQIKSQRESPWQQASHSVHQHAQRFGQRSFQKKAKCGGGCICFSTQTKPFWDFLQEFLINDQCFPRLSGQLATVSSWGPMSPVVHCA